MKVVFDRCLIEKKNQIVNYQTYKHYFIYILKL